MCCKALNDYFKTEEIPGECIPTLGYWPWFKVDERSRDSLPIIGSLVSKLATSRTLESQCVEFSIILGVLSYFARKLITRISGSADGPIVRN